MSSILVVDDDPDIRLLVRLELASDGHQLLGAADGAEALRILESTPVDLMLLDIMMPVLDGWGVLRAIDHNGPPVIVVTALATGRNTHVADLLREGAVDVVAKPFDPDYLSQLCRAVLLVDEQEREEYRRRRLEEAAR